MKIKLISIAFILALFSCGKEKQAAEQAEIDNAIIVKYLSDNNLEAKATSSGLYYLTDVLGTGIIPLSNSIVSVAYKGYLVDGTVFDESDTVGITISLAQVIKGWQEGIPLYREGSKGKLFIPSALGYGTQGSGAIPKNAVLIFEVDLIKVY